MLDPVSSVLTGMPGGIARDTLSKILRPIVSALSSQLTSSGALAVGGVTTTAKTASAITYVANGIHGSLTARDMPALPTGFTISAGKYNVVVFYVDSAGNTSVKTGTEGATAALVKFPTPAEGVATIGYCLITYASQFVAGSTPLSTATTVYVNTLGYFDPSIVN